MENNEKFYFWGSQAIAIFSFAIGLWALDLSVGGHMHTLMAIFVVIFVVLALIAIVMTWYFGIKGMRNPNKKISQNEVKLNAIIKKLKITPEDIENEKTDTTQKK